MSMKKQPEITAQTRENLVEAFWSLYSHKKIEHISVKEITAKAGYHRSTFYEYFVDMYDLLDQLEEALLTYIKDAVLNSLSVDLNADLIQNLAEKYESQGKYLSVLLGENGDPNFGKKVKEAMGPALTKSFGLSASDVHTAYIMEFGFSAILSTLTLWYQSSKNLPSPELVYLIRSMLLSGVYPMAQKYAELAPEDAAQRLAGLHKEIWQGIDAQQYVNEQRSERAPDA